MPKQRKKKPEASKSADAQPEENAPEEQPTARKSGGNTHLGEYPPDHPVYQEDAASITLIGNPDKLKEVPDQLKQAGITPGQWEDIKQFVALMLHRAKEQNIICCWEASDGKHVCILGEELCCRTCCSWDVERREIIVGNPMFWPKWKTEPSAEDIMVSYYCDTCERLTMVSLAQHCPQCGLCLFALSEDEEIFGMDEKE